MQHEHHRPRPQPETVQPPRIRQAILLAVNEELDHAAHAENAAPCVVPTADHCGPAGSSFILKAISRGRAFGVPYPQPLKKNSEYAYR
jgi:hypothetical protein